MLVVNVAKDTIDPRVGSVFWRFKYDQVGYSRKDHPNCSSVRWPQVIRTPQSKFGPNQILTVMTNYFYYYDTTTTNKPTAFTIATYLLIVCILWRHKSLNWSEDEGWVGGGGVEIMQKLFIHPRRHLTFIDCTWMDCGAQRTLIQRFGPCKVATEFLKRNRTDLL